MKNCDDFQEFFECVSCGWNCKNDYLCKVAHNKYKAQFVG